MTDSPDRGIAWAAVAVGAMAGLGVTLALFLLLGILGLVDRVVSVPVLVLQFFGLVLAGFVAGTVAGRARVLTGGLAGIAVFAVAGLIAMAGSGAPASPIVLAFSAALGALLGSVGGTVAEWHSLRRDTRSSD